MKRIFRKLFFRLCVGLFRTPILIYKKKNWLEKNTYLHLNLIDFKIQNFNIFCTLFNNTIMYQFI